MYDELLILINNKNFGYNYIVNECCKVNDISALEFILGNKGNGFLKNSIYYIDKKIINDINILKLLVKYGAPYDEEVFSVYPELFFENISNIPNLKIQNKIPDYSTTKKLLEYGYVITKDFAINILSNGHFTYLPLIHEFASPSMKLQIESVIKYVVNMGVICHKLSLLNGGTTSQYEMFEKHSNKTSIEIIEMINNYNDSNITNDNNSDIAVNDDSNSTVSQ
jgi:hypothetical protein